jgi:Uma2 family endonuclease
MSPTGGKHGIIEFRLSSALGRFVEQHGLGGILTGEVGIYIRRDPDMCGVLILSFCQESVGRMDRQKDFWTKRQIS